MSPSEPGTAKRKTTTAVLLWTFGDTPDCAVPGAESDLRINSFIPHFRVTEPIMTKVSHSVREACTFAVKVVRMLLAFDSLHLSKLKRR